jgi:glycosyltransferase involved in cell wall biosynthesis
MHSPARHERVAVITTSFPRHAGDAAGHFVLAEVRALERSGAEVTVIAAGHSEQPPADCDVHFAGGGALFDWPGALPRLRENPLRARHALEFLRRARQVLREAGPFDRIIAHWLVPCAYPLLVGPWLSSRHADAELEAVAHGSDVRLLARLPSRVRGSILRALSRRNVRLRFVSHALREELLRAPGLSHELHAWVESRSEIRPAEIEITGVPNRAEARAHLGIAADALLVAIIGRLVPGKRTDVALAAAHLLPEARVVVVGGGPEQARLALAYPDAAFVGQLARDAALRWLAAADVLISSSREEGAPTAIREARALGVPVVARAAGDLERWSREDSELWVI